LKEAKLLNQESEGQIIANELIRVKNRGKNEINTSCARLYSAESFLYKLVNSTLRADDRSKIDTLGAYCWLLDKELTQMGDFGDRTVYRGANLSDELIEEYKKAVGTAINWLAFTSASKDRRIAEQFGNTLFIMKVIWLYKRDISTISHYDGGH